jgi:hypothetical protein
MRNVSPDFGAGLTSFAAGFLRPDNGLSSVLKSAALRKSREKRNERPWRTPKADAPP